jgi:hypothetical protein
LFATKLILFFKPVQGMPNFEDNDIVAPVRAQTAPAEVYLYVFFVYLHTKMSESKRRAWRNWRECAAATQLNSPKPKTFVLKKKKLVAQDPPKSPAPATQIKSSPVVASRSRAPSLAAPDKKKELRKPFKAPGDVDYPG